MNCLIAQYRRRTFSQLLLGCIACLPMAALTVPFLVAPSALRGQSAGTASLQGSVKDSSGASIPGAQVVYTNTETGAKRETRSSGSGDYSLPNVPVGNYSLSIAATGFTGFKQNGTLEVGSNATVDAAL